MHANVILTDNIDASSVMCPGRPRLRIIWLTTRWTQLFWIPSSHPLLNVYRRIQACVTEHPRATLVDLRMFK